MGRCPHPGILRKFAREGAAVSSRYSPRIRSPLGVTPERGGRGADGLRRSQAGGGALEAVCLGGRGAGGFRRGGAAGASGARGAGAFLPGGGGKPGAGGLGRVRRTKAAWRARRCGAGMWPGGAARAVCGAFRGGRGQGAAGAKADGSCGIHIHIGLGEHTPQSLRRLVNIVNAKEDLLTMALGITPECRERWCRPVEQRFLTELNRRKPATMDEFARIWYRQSGGTNSDWRVCARQHYDYSRYHLLNLHATFSTERPAHTIEFRAFNGTLHAGEIKAYIQLCLAISAQALSTKAASSTRPVTDNLKYTFRCWLLRLGFIGDEFSTAREHLLKKLPGNAAWRQAS